MPTIPIRDTRPRHDPMPQAEWGLLRAYLARRGMSQADINAAIGDALDARTRAEITDRLTSWLQQKGQ